MKKGKIIARIVFSLGIVFGTANIVGVIRFPEQMNFLNPYVIWGYGLVIIGIFSFYLYLTFQKPKPHRKK